MHDLILLFAEGDHTNRTGTTSRCGGVNDSSMHFLFALVTFGYMNDLRGYLPFKIDLWNVDF